MKSNQVSSQASRHAQVNLRKSWTRSIIISLGLFFVTYNFGLYNVLGYFLGRVKLGLSFNETKTFLSMLNLALLYPMVIGAFASLYLLSIIGRKLTVLICAVIATVGIGLTSIETVSGMIVGRAILGLSAGVTIVYIPVYIREIVPFENRWGFCIIPALIGGLGYFFIFSFGLRNFDDPDDEAYWRVITLFPAVFNIIQVILWWNLPESPKFLSIDKGNTQQARNILREIYNDFYPNNDVQAHVEQTIASYEKEKELLGKNTNLGNWFKKFSRLQFYGIILGAILQVTGLSMIVFYSNWTIYYNELTIHQVDIYKVLDKIQTILLGNQASVWTFFFGLILLLTPIVTYIMLTRTKFQPNNLISIGLSLITIIDLFIAVLYSSHGWVAGRIFQLLWTMAFGIFIHAPLFLLMGDILPLAGIAISMAISQLIQLAIVIPYPWLLYSGWGSSPNWFFFSFFSCLGLLIILKKYYGTKDIPLVDTLIANDRYPKIRLKDSSLPQYKPKVEMVAPPAPPSLQNLLSSSVVMNRLDMKEMPPTVLYNV